MIRDDGTNRQALAPLWPNQNIPIIGVTGEFGSGKTLFGLTIDPAHTLVYDTEQSAISYQSLGFARVDIPYEMMRNHPKGYKPLETFQWWLQHVHDITPGTYRVIVLDTVSELEAGLVEWVRGNPQAFGHTAGQYAKMSGLMWGDAKDLWKRILSDIAARCQTIVFTSHMANIWIGERPTGKRKPKGKETLMELSSLSLLLERRADKEGKVPDKPSGVVLKSRLASTRINPQTGEIEIVPTLPPRLPIATPHAIRQYMLTPPNYSNLKHDELAPEQALTDDERAQVRLAIAEAERETEAFKLERLGRQQSAADRAAPPMAQSQSATPAESSGHGKISTDKLSTIQECYKQLIQAGLSEDRWGAILAQYGVATTADLTPEQGENLLDRCLTKLADLSEQNARHMQEGGDEAKAKMKS